MHKLKILLITLLVVLILVAGGIWGYLWYSTRQQVEQLIAAAKPFADISYGGIEVLPSGSMGVTQVRVIPHFVEDVISVGAIRINAPNILALLNIRRQLSQGEIPAALSLSVDQFDVPLHGGLIGSGPPSAQERMPFDGLDALGCGPVTHFGGVQWQEMGYERFVSNLKIGYRLDDKQLNISISDTTRNWAMLNLEMGFALAAPLHSVMEVATLLTPKLTHLSATFQDDGYNTHRNAYCTAKAGKPVNEYLAEHVRLLVERLRANGIQPGPGLIAAYQQFLADGAHLTLTAQPPTPIDPAELPLYKAADAVKLVGLAVKINDQAVSDLSADWNTALVIKALGIGATRPAAAAEAVKEPSAVPIPQPTVIQRSFHPVPVSDLGRHVGKIVKLHTNTGANYQGILNALADGTATITLRKGSGSATLHLRNQDITEAQVFY